MSIGCWSLGLPPRRTPTYFFALELRPHHYLSLYGLLTARHGMQANLSGVNLESTDIDRFWAPLPRLRPRLQTVQEAKEGFCSC